MLIDSHCHLDFDAFAPELDQVIARALASDVRYMVTISTRVRQFDRIRALTEKYANVFCSIGTHPHNAHEETDVTVEELVQTAGHAKVVAIGEAGLDYHYDHAPPATQKEGFLKHIEAARQSGLPLVIHSRDADEDMEQILRQESRKGAFTFILHCYSSGMKLARAGIELGGYVSFSGILTFRNAQDIREIAKIIPQDRLLVETDAPYLAPVPFRGQRNEPSFVVRTAEVLARTRETDITAVAAVTTRNALQLFHKINTDMTGK